ncbi:MAG: polysaccharide deacetylase family protein [Chitinivibrionales bacterium]|nr:polysaccharide deacetylase family protein [Chitinivibrionales bacterium]
MDTIVTSIKTRVTIKTLGKRACLAYCYHKIKNCPTAADIYAVTRRNFRDQMQMVAKYFKPVSLSNYVLKNPVSNRPRVLMTFDDGNLSDYTEALPILIELGIPAVFFITIDYIGKPNHLNKQQIQEIASQPYMAIGSHSLSHPDFGLISKKRAELELVRSRQELSDITGKDVMTFSFPYGNIWNTKDHDSALIEKAGYTSAFLFGTYQSHQHQDRYHLPRFMATDINESTLLRHSIAVLKSYNTYEWF